MERSQLSFFEMFRCPLCMARIQRVDEEMLCDDTACGGRFPIIDGVPVLLNEAESVFSIGDYISRRATTVGVRTLLHHAIAGVARKPSAMAWRASV